MEENKQFNELSDEELQNVNGGTGEHDLARDRRCKSLKLQCQREGKEQDPRTCRCIEK